MPGIDTLRDAQPSTESVTITVFGRLALLRSQVKAALDDETADRQYALEQVSAELARVLDETCDEARVNTATVAGGAAFTPTALAAGEVPR